MTIASFTVWLMVIGTWLLCDCIYSFCTQYKKGNGQTWLRDHWVRVVRGIFGIQIIYMGWYFASQMMR